MITLNSRERDEFLKALEEARRSAMTDDEGGPKASRKPKATTSYGSAEFLHTIDRMASKVRSYMSAGVLTRLYSDGFSRPPVREAAPAPAPPPKSVHEQVVDELHLTPSLTSTDLKLIRRRFAKANHPDRVPPAIREQASRRMTIANSLIDEALRGFKVRPR